MLTALLSISSLILLMLALYSINELFWGMPLSEVKSRDNRMHMVRYKLLGAVLIAILLASVQISSHWSGKLSEDQLAKIVRNAVTMAYFDPAERYNGHDTRWHYPFGPGNGLMHDCSDSSIFNLFDDCYSVLRLWANPEEKSCFIKAHRDKDENHLLVSFERSGHVDITIPPRGNKPVIVGDNNFLSISLTNACTCDIDLRFRLVDERGIQWAWAREMDRVITGSDTALKYKKYDSNHTELTLEGHTKLTGDSGTRKASKKPTSFTFSLLRSAWTRFPSDGSNAPIRQTRKFFAIQGIVVEPGVRTKKETSSGSNSRKRIKAQLEHDRQLDTNSQVGEFHINLIRLSQSSNAPGSKQTADAQANASRVGGNND